MKKKLINKNVSNLKQYEACCRGNLIKHPILNDTILSPHQLKPSTAGANTGDII